MGPGVSTGIAVTRVLISMPRSRLGNNAHARRDGVARNAIAELVQARIQSPSVQTLLENALATQTLEESFVTKERKVNFNTNLPL